MIQTLLGKKLEDYPGYLLRNNSEYTCLKNGMPQTEKTVNITKVRNKTHTSLEKIGWKVFSMNDILWSDFWCRYCGKKFGQNPQKLALHMARNCKILNS